MGWQYAMELPFSLTIQDMKLEEGCEGRVELSKALERLTPVEGWLDEDTEVEQILRAALILYASSPGRYRLADCIDTATVWSRG